MSSESVAEQTQVRSLRPTEVRYAADLHRQCLPHGFFARLGPRFLRAYHQTFLDSPFAVSYLAVSHGRPVGVLVGTLDNAAHYAWMGRHRSVRLALCALAGLACRPRLAVWFLRTRAGRYLRSLRRALARSGGAHAQPGASAPLPVAVLTHVYVDPAARGRGIGRTLVDRLLADAAEAGAGEVSLVTMAGQRGAGGFYSANGWIFQGDRLDRDGHLISGYSRSLR